MDGFDGVLVWVYGVWVYGCMVHGVGVSQQGDDGGGNNTVVLTCEWAAGYHGTVSIMVLITCNLQVHAVYLTIAHSLPTVCPQKTTRQGASTQNTQAHIATSNIHRHSQKYMKYPTLPTATQYMHQNSKQ